MKETDSIIFEQYIKSAEFLPIIGQLPETEGLRELDLERWDSDPSIPLGE